MTSFFLYPYSFSLHVVPSIVLFGMYRMPLTFVPFIFYFYHLFCILFSHFLPLSHLPPFTSLLFQDISSLMPSVNFIPCIASSPRFLFFPLLSPLEISLFRPPFPLSPLQDSPLVLFLPSQTQTSFSHQVCASACACVSRHSSALSNLSC